MVRVCFALATLPFICTKHGMTLPSSASLDTRADKLPPRYALEGGVTLTKRRSKATGPLAVTYPCPVMIALYQHTFRGVDRADAVSFSVLCSVLFDHWPCFVRTPLVYARYVMLRVTIRRERRTRCTRAAEERTWPSSFQRLI